LMDSLCTCYQGNREVDPGHRRGLLRLEELASVFGPACAFLRKKWWQCLARDECDRGKVGERGDRAARQLAGPVNGEIRGRARQFWPTPDAAKRNSRRGATGRQPSCCPCGDRYGWASGADLIHRYLRRTHSVGRLRAPSRMSRLPTGSYSSRLLLGGQRTACIAALLGARLGGVGRAAPAAGLDDRLNLDDD
jgi:hypothetical protein